MLIAGVDLGGKKAAVALLDDDKLISAQAFASSSARRQDQLYEVADFVDQAVGLADAVYVEEPLIGRGVRASLQIAQCAGAVLANIGPPAYLVPVATWKKEVVGSGNATKESVSFWLRTAHSPYSDICEDDQDLADACCIALYGRKVQALADSFRDR